MIITVRYFLIIFWDLTTSIRTIQVIETVMSYYYKNPPRRITSTFYQIFYECIRGKDEIKDKKKIKIQQKSLLKIQILPFIFFT